MRVTIIVQTKVDARIEPKYWFSVPRSTPVERHFSRPFKYNPFTGGEVLNVRIGETINLNPGGPRIDCKIADIRHIDNEIIEIVVKEDYLKWGLSWSEGAELRAEHAAFVERLEQVGYKEMSA